MTLESFVQREGGKITEENQRAIIAAHTFKVAEKVFFDGFFHGKNGASFHQGHSSRSHRQQYGLSGGRKHGDPAYIQTRSVPHDGKLISLRRFEKPSAYELLVTGDSIVYAGVLPDSTITIFDKELRKEDLPAAEEEVMRAFRAVANVLEIDIPPEPTPIAPAA